MATGGPKLQPGLGHVQIAKGPGKYTILDGDGKVMMYFELPHTMEYQAAVLEDGQTEIVRGPGLAIRPKSRIVLS